MTNLVSLCKGFLDRMINAFLSPYVEGLDMNQVSYGITSGTITLRDLRVKKSALDKLNLPFEIIEGRVGLLQLSLHWASLGMAPVQLRLEDVHALVASTSETKYDATEDEKRKQQLKQERLLRAEALRFETPDDGASKPGFMAAFQYKILNNLQIELKNIHLRFEDRKTVPKHPFAAGLTLAAFNAYSTDGQWRPAFVSGEATEVHKIAELDSASIYFDTDCETYGGLSVELSKKKFTESIPSATHAAKHQYILKPVTGQGRIIWNRGWDDERPRYDIQFFFDEIGSTLDQHQYRDIISLADVFHIYARQHQYRKFRPPEEEFAKNKSRALWKFAISAILDNVHEKNRRWTWEFFKERRNDRHRYVELFKIIETRAAIPKSSEDSDKKELDTLERKLEFSDIRFFRSIARQELQKDRRAMAMLEERRRQERRQQTYSGWVLDKIWGSSTPNQQSGDDTEIQISPETWKEVYDMVGYDEKKALAESFERPGESIKTRISAQLKQGTFSLKASPHDDNRDLISLVFDQFEAGFLQREFGFEGSLSLRDFKVFDGTSKNTLYRQIVHVKDNARSSGKSSKKSSDDEEDEPFFSLKFEHRPLDERADNGLTVFLRSMEIIYQKGYVEAIYRFFKPPESQLISVDALLTAAGETLQGFTSVTRAGLEYALQTHETVDLKLNLHAPIIIIPESTSTTDCNYLVIDAGQVLVESNLVDKATMREIEQKRKHQYTDKDFKKLESLMYDSFTIKLKDAQFVIGRGIQACRNALANDSHDHRMHLLERININFIAKNSIVPTVRSIPRFKVSGTLPNLHVNFSDSKYKTLMRLLDVTIPQFDNGTKATAPHPQYQFPADFFSQEPEEYNVDVESVGHSSKHSELSTHASDSTAVDSRQELFLFSFNVNSLRASLFRTSDDGTEMLLADGQLERFDLSLVNAQYDLTVDIHLGSIRMSVPQANEADLPLLTTQTEQSDDKNLMTVQYKRVQHEHPDFLTVYEGIEQTVDVKFSTFIFTAVPEQVLTLYEFIMSTFVPEGEKQPVQTNDTLESLPSTDNQAIGTRQVDDEKIRVRVELASVEVVLINEGKRVATISLLTASVSVSLHAEDLQVSARLGNLLVTDDSDIETKDNSFKKLLSIEGDELAELHYHTFGPEDRTTKGANSSVVLKTGALKAHFLEVPLTSIYRFLVKLARLKGLYDAAAQAAVQRASEIERTLFNVTIRSPIVIFPTDALHSTDSLTMKLGELSAHNEFRENTQRIFASLKGISFSSAVSKENALSSLKIVDDVTISIKVTQTLVIHREEDVVTPDYQIEANISDVKLNLIQLQCQRLLDLSKSIPRVFELETDSEVLPVAIADPQLEELEGKAPDQEGTDLMPELSVSQSPGHRKWTTVDLVLSLHALKVGLYEEGANHDKDLRDHGIVRFALNNTSMTLKMLSDNALEVEVAVKSLTMSDTKPGHSKFREIIPAVTHERNQFMLLFTMSGGINPSSVAIVTVDSPQIIFSVNPIFSLLTFFVGALEDPTASVDVITDTTNDGLDQKSVEQSQASFDIRFDLHDALVSILENDADAESRAIQLHMKQLSFSQQGIVALNINQLGMSLARMGKIKESVRFMDDFDVTLSMNTRTEEAQTLTDISISCQPIIFRASYRDIDLILSIANHSYELFSNTMNERENGKSKVAPTTVATSSKPTAKRGVSRTSVGRTSSAVSTRAKVIVTKEKLSASCEGFQFILIDDLHEMPMFILRTDSFTTSAMDWTGQLSASTRLSTSINYYNLKNSHWEPFIDPWSFTILAQKRGASPGIYVTLKSSEQLDMNLSSSFVELTLSTLTLWDKEGKKVLQKARGSYAPYRLVNRTGTTLQVWSDVSGKKGEVKRLINGEDADWRFDDWKTTREHFTTDVSSVIGVQFESKSWDQVRGLQVDTEGEFVYTLRPDSGRMPNKLLSEVTIKDNVKIVTLRSTYKVVNQTLYPLEVTLVDNTGRPVYAVEKIAPGQTFFVPIEAVTQNRIRIQPDQGFGYRWSSALRWEDLMSARGTGLTLRCPHKDQTEAPFRFRLWPVTDSRDLDYPRITLNLRAPIELENLLPFNIQYKIYDRDAEQNWSSYLRKGGIMPVHSVELGHLVLLNITIQDSVFKPSDFAIINADAKSDFDVETQLNLSDEQGRKLELKLNYVKYPDSGGAFKVQIYSPFIVVNKTGLPYSVKSVRSLSTGFTKDVAGDTRQAETARTTPFLLSHPFKKGTEFIFQVSDCAWSQVINLEAPSAETEMVLESTSKKADAHLGLSWSEGLGRYKLTKVITIAPRYLIQNKLDNELYFREHCMPLNEGSLLSSGQRCPFLFVRQQSRLTIAYPGLDAQWSSPINMDVIGSSHLRMRPPGSRSISDVHLVEIDVAIEKATIFVTVRPHRGPWPFVIDNSSDLEIVFGQTDTVHAQPEGELMYKVKPRSKISYVWDYPAEEKKRLFLVCNGQSTYIDIMQIGVLLPMKTQRGSLSFDVMAEGSTQVLVITPYVPETSLYKPKNRIGGLRDSVSSSQEFEAIQQEAPLIFSFGLDLAGLGISLVNRRLCEVVYCSVRELKVDLSVNDVAKTVDISCGLLQIDNQLHDAQFPVVLQPTPISRQSSSASASLPTVQASFVVLNDNAHGVLFIKYASILLQALTIQLDEAFLYAILDLTKLPGLDWESDSENVLIEYPDDIPEPTLDKSGQDVYFELLELQPVILLLSFVRNISPSEDDSPKLTTTNPLAVAFNVLTLTLGNLGDARLEFNALGLTDARMTVPDLEARILYHYRQEVLRQLYRVLGSANFLGNPVGLFTNVSSGVADIFYEPWNGVVQHGGAELGAGLAKGATSFLKKTVFGITDSVTKVTGSLGKGLSAATLDPEYQARRVMNQRRNKPKHAITGVAVGVEALAGSVASGVEGVVMKPYEGAESEGAFGFLKGMGKGLIGFVTKPVVGVFDLASNVSEGIRNTTTVFDAPERDRVRKPRHIPADGILRPYSTRKALGQYWMMDLENGAYRKEHYIAHLDIPGSDTVVLVNDYRVLKFGSRRLSLEWDLPFSSLKGVSKGENGIVFKHKDPASDKFIIIEDSVTRLSFYNEIVSAVNAYTARRRRERHR